MTGRTDDIRKVIEHLNAIGVGDIGAIDVKLQAVIDDLARLGITEQKETVEAARGQLGGGDLQEFRRLLAQAVSKLGHLR